MRPKMKRSHASPERERWHKVAGIKSLGGDVHNLQIVGNDIEYNHATADGSTGSVG